MIFFLKTIVFNVVLTMASIILFNPINRFCLLKRMPNSYLTVSLNEFNANL